MNLTDRRRVLAMLKLDESELTDNQLLTALEQRLTVPPPEPPKAEEPKKQPPPEATGAMIFTGNVSRKSVNRMVAIHQLGPFFIGKPLYPGLDRVPSNEKEREEHERHEAVVLATRDRYFGLYVFGGTKLTVLPAEYNERGERVERAKPAANSPNPGPNPARPAKER